MVTPFGIYCLLRRMYLSPYWALTLSLSTNLADWEIDSLRC